MNRRGIEIVGGFQVDRNAYSVWLLERTSSGNRVSNSIEFVDVPDGERFPPPIEIEPHGFQKLMDDLWRMGVRPTEHRAEGAVAAIESHLLDMRTLAFHHAGIDLPKRGPR